MSALLREWDQASKARRKKLLRWLNDRFQSSRYTSELEQECGSDISLLLPRVLSWMRKTSLSTEPTVTAAAPERQKSFGALSEQLACINLFLVSANAHMYYRTFQEANGLALLLEALVLPVKSILAADRLLIYQMLRRIAQMSRSNREQITQLDGELAMIRGALETVAEQSDEDIYGDDPMQLPVWCSCRSALLQQMGGNATGIAKIHSAIVFMLTHSHAGLQVFGAQILRELVTLGSFYCNEAYASQRDVELVRLCMDALQSTHIPRQHEGLALAHAFLQRSRRQSDICEALSVWIREAAMTPENHAERFLGIQNTREYEMYVHLRSPFVHAAQSINTLMHSNPPLLSTLMEGYDLLTPLAFTLVVERPHSLKWFAAAVTLHYVFTSQPQATAVHLAKLFKLSHVQTAWRKYPAEELCKRLLQSETHQRQLMLQFYQQGWRVVMQPTTTKQDADPETEGLCAIKRDVEAAVRDFVPELQWRSGHDAEGQAEEDEEEDLYSDFMDAQREQDMRLRLTRHFAQFRTLDALKPIH